jgi:hypothetical protein
MKHKVDWFARGRDAFTEGVPCFIRDARLTGQDRQAWYAGWRHQQNLNTCPAEATELAATLAALQAIRDSL